MDEKEVKDAVEQERETQEAFYGEDKNETTTPEDDKASEENPTENLSTPPKEGEEKDSEGEKKEATATDGEEDKAEDVVEYNLKLEEDSPLDASHIDLVSAFAKENKLSNEQAQALLKQQEETVASFWDKQVEAAEKEKEVWRQTIIDDPTLGGENLKTNSENAKRVVQRFGDEDFINLLRDTGYGDHPAVFRVLSKLGAMMSEDTLVLPGQSKQSKSAEELMYGSN